jgi:signal transduction histidine kinase
MDKSGVVVNYEEVGESFPLGSSAELAIYRILQEALNNSRTHGGPGTTAKVSMTWSAQGMHLRIDDDGIRTRNKIREEAGENTAYGIVEHQRALIEILDGRGMKDMRARTEAFGGVFSAHRIPGVGFSISAAFPTLRYHNGVHGVDVRGRSEGTRS